MELMSFLLLYTMALFAGLAEARFGLVRGNYVLNENRTFVLQKESRNYEKKIHLRNIKQTNSHQDSTLNLIKQNHCIGCIECVMSVLKSQKNKPLFYDLNDIDDMREDSARSVGEINHAVHFRTKREDYSSDHQLTLSKKKKNKGKRSKEQRLVTVTEYKIAGDVYALKAKNSHRNQTNDDDSSSPDTCKIYKVIKSFPCDSADGESLLAFAKKNSKRKVKFDSKLHQKTTEKPSVATTKAPDGGRNAKAPSKKRQVDYGSATAPENYMPSIEDMYNN